MNLFRRRKTPATQQVSTTPPTEPIESPSKPRLDPDPNSETLPDGTVVTHFASGVTWFTKPAPPVKCFDFDGNERPWP